MNVIIAIETLSRNVKELYFQLRISHQRNEIDRLPRVVCFSDAPQSVICIHHIKMSDDRWSHIPCHAVDSITIFISTSWEHLNENIELNSHRSISIKKNTICNYTISMSVSIFFYLMLDQWSSYKIAMKFLCDGSIVSRAFYCSEEKDDEEEEEKEEENLFTLRVDCVRLSSLFYGKRAAECIHTKTYSIFYLVIMMIHNI